MAIESVRGVVRSIAKSAPQGRVQFTLEVGEGRQLCILIKKPAVTLIVGAEVTVSIMGPVADGQSFYAGLAVE